MITPEYAAGFFDGEGTVNLTRVGKRKSVALRVYIVNTDEAILKAFRRQFGGFLASRQNGPDKWKPFRVLTITGYGAIAFLKIIEPFSVLKARQIQLAFEFWEYQHSPGRMVVIRTPTTTAPYHVNTARSPEALQRDQAFVDAMKLLNRKGAHRGQRAA